MQSSPATNLTQQRKLRSDSNLNKTITLNDIKLLIENSKAEILSSLKKEIDGLTIVLTKLNKRVEEVESKNLQLEERVQQLEDDHANLLSEIEDRDRRKSNLIISGIPEKVDCSSDERRQWDEEVSATLFQSLGEAFNTTAITGTYRIGKIDPKKPPRLLRVTCRDAQTKREIVKKAANLRNIPKYRNVYINPDRTPKEQREHKRLTEELKRRKSLGERVKIRDGKIVSRQLEDVSSVKNFR